MKLIPESVLKRLRSWKQNRLSKTKNRKKFSKRNKMIVKARSKYGMWGISLLTPILLSIPLGAFLIRKYYHHRKEAIPVMVLTIVVEGIVISIISWYIYHIKMG